MIISSDPRQIIEIGEQEKYLFYQNNAKLHFLSKKVLKQS